jgi:hypothetical protein
MLAQAGDVASANFLGYLLGALACSLPLRLRRGGGDRQVGSTGSELVVMTGLLATAALTAAMALPWPALWPFLRLAAGVASAFAFVHATGWCLNQLALRGRTAIGGLMPIAVSTNPLISPLAIVIIGGFGTNNLIIDPWVRIAGGNQVPENSIALRATLWSPGPNGLREGGKGDDLPDPRVFAWSAVNLPRGTTMTPDGVVVGGPLTGEAQIVADDGQGNTVQRRLLIVSPDWNLRIRDF